MSQCSYCKRWKWNTVKPAQDDQPGDREKRSIWAGGCWEEYRLKTCPMQTVNCKFNPKLLSSFYAIQCFKAQYLYTNVLDSKGTLMLSVTIQAFMRRCVLDRHIWNNYGAPFEFDARYVLIAYLPTRVNVQYSWTKALHRSFFKKYEAIYVSAVIHFIMI